MLLTSSLIFTSLASHLTKPLLVNNCILLLTLCVLFIACILTLGLSLSQGFLSHHLVITPNTTGETSMHKVQYLFLDEQFYKDNEPQI